MKISVGKRQVIALFDEAVAASPQSTFLQDYLPQKAAEQRRRSAAPARYRQSGREGRRILLAEQGDSLLICTTSVSLERFHSYFPFVEAEDLIRK